MEGGIPPEEGQRSSDKIKVKWRHLSDRLCTSGTLLRTSHELVLSKIRASYFFKDAIWRIEHTLMPPPGGRVTN